VGDSRASIENGCFGCHSWRSGRSEIDGGMSKSVKLQGHKSERRTTEMCVLNSWVITRILSSSAVEAVDSLLFDLG
jgi:hypothetical protein